MFGDLKLEFSIGDWGNKFRISGLETCTVLSEGERERDRGGYVYRERDLHSAAREQVCMGVREGEIDG